MTRVRRRLVGLSGLLLLGATDIAADQRRLVFHMKKNLSKTKSGWVVPSRSFDRFYSFILIF